MSRPKLTIDHWAPKEIGATGHDSIAEMMDSTEDYSINKQFLDFQDALERYQSDDTTTETEINLSLDSLITNLKYPLCYGSGNLWSNITVDSNNQWVSDTELQDYLKKSYEKSLMVSYTQAGTTYYKIVQAKTTIDSHITNKFISVAVNTSDFALGDNTTRADGTYRFEWDDTESRWLLTFGSTVVGYVTLSDYGITVTYNGGSLVDGDYFTVTFAKEGDVTEEWLALFRITKISQLDNTEALTGKPHFLNYRDIIVLDKTSAVVELVNNPDTDYSFVYKAYIDLSDDLFTHEKEAVLHYTPSLAFSEDYAAYCSQISKTEIAADGNPYLVYYTNSALTSVGDIAIMLTYKDYNTLPSGYNEASYIKSTGTQYIALDLDEEDINEGYVAELVVSFTELEASSNDSYMTMIGNVSEDDVELSGSINAQTGIWTLGVGSTKTVSTQSATTNARYSVRVSVPSGSQEIRNIGQQVVTSSETYSITAANTNDLFLFAINNKGTAANFSKMRLYRARIYTHDCGKMLADLKVCYRDSDKEPGVYDFVGSRFITGSGTDKFIIGVNGNLSDYVISGPTDPSIFKKGNLGQFYLNTTTGKYFVCSLDENGASVWTPSLVNYYIL